MHSLTLPDARTLDLPTRWGEVTLGQAARLAEIDDLDTYNLLSVLLNLSPIEVMNLPVAFVNEQVLPWLAWASEPVPDLSNAPLPATISLPLDLCTKVLSVPAALDIATFGQATDLGALLQDTTTPVSQKRLRALAILFYPLYIGGDYDSDAIDDFAADVCSHAKLEQALPITDFFLQTTTASAAATLPSSSASPSPVTSVRPASSSWWKSGMRWLWSTHWPLATKRSGPTSGA